MNTEWAQQPGVKVIKLFSFSRWSRGEISLSPLARPFCRRGHELVFVLCYFSI
jgi:hypothetical protein